jgi:predicted RNA binding protein YcfA (HicA-like mRNA interferase family)
MPKIALVANNCRSRSLYLQNSRLPAFYMEDFSVLGLLVERYEEACALLQNDGYTVLEAKGGSDVNLVHPDQIVTIIDTLKKNGIATELADIADTIYQA